MYKPDSRKADEFINAAEIEKTVRYAREHSSDRELLENILKKAEEGHGLGHREAAALLECRLPDINSRIFSLAREIKQKLYSNRIVIFAPLYLSNYCINSCTYCPYHSQNRTMPRKRLSQDEIAAEVTALQDMGHKRLAIESGEDPVHSPIEYILESLQTIYSVKHKNGAIRRANVNIAATTVENYRKLHDAGIGTYILFQETYDRESYGRLHPRGPKSDYNWHTEAMDRAMEGGVDDVGIGVLFGLSGYLREFAGLLMHAEHLEVLHGTGPHTISGPRLCPADGIDTAGFKDALPDEIFLKIVAMIRISVPYTGMIISTRESKAVREKVLELGISQISGGSNTGVGGYSTDKDGHTQQFDVSDHRTLDEIIGWLTELGYIPSFCTACYRLGRTGERFMSIVKSGGIGQFCTPNALLTLKEYLTDYASETTRKNGLEQIRYETEKIMQESAGNQAKEAIAAKLISSLRLIENGERDFRF